MAVLLHGTTFDRANRLLKEPPDPDFVEPGGGPSAGSFSASLEAGPFPLGTPEMYALAKAKNFPAEGGPAILGVDVPDDIISLAVDEVYLPLSQGVVQFEAGAGLEELRAAWPGLAKWAVRVKGQAS
jgi:hypothetical protein